jgi:CrcB protein
MSKILWVGLGGLLGSVCRHLLCLAIHERLLPSAGFAVGTLAGNVRGGFAAGILLGLPDGKGLLSPEGRAFAAVGFLGGLTTFSAFGVDSFRHLHRDQVLAFALNIGANVGLGVVAVWTGYRLVVKL